MPDHLCITVRFLDGMFHGRSDGGEPEWPPSPLRLFQALVAAGAARWNERGALKQCKPALCWLESQPAPIIVAPTVQVGAKYRLYVPDNVGDLVARSWSRGNDAKIADYRTEKEVRPIRLIGSDAVHYLWSLAGNDSDFLAVKDMLLETVHSVTHVGWGIDQVVAHGSMLSEIEVSKLEGQRWHSSEDGSANTLRVPVAGTLDDLNQRYEAFLKRARLDSFVPVAPLSMFRLASYPAANEPPRIPFAAFSLLKQDASGFRSYDPVRNGMRVAGMMRHAASDDKIAAALGLSKVEVARFVLGHAEEGDLIHVPVDGPRLAFIPLPSIEKRENCHEVVGSIRRVLIVGLRGCSREELTRVAQLMSGQSLIEERSREAAALLSRIPDSESMIRRYTRASATWATVTPVILPGYDDPRKYRQRLASASTTEASALGSDQQKLLLSKLDKRIEFLIRKAIRQAGCSVELATYAEINWRGSGFWPGTDLASRYAVPEKLRRFRRLHVRITWRDATGNPILLNGPLCLGSGRFIGLGLLAPLS